MAVATCTNFRTMYYVPDHPMTKQSTTKFPAILDSARLIVSGELNNGWWWGRWVGKGLMKENLSGRLRVEPDKIMGPKLTTMKPNSH